MDEKENNDDDDVSRDRVFLEKAKDIGDRLLRAFDTPTGIPRAQVNLNSGRSANARWAGSSSILAELGTLQAVWSPDSAPAVRC